MSDCLDTARRLFQEGVGKFRAGDYPGAEAHFRQALAVAPPRASVLTNLANALLAQGKVADAVAFAQRSVQLDGAGADAWYVHGRCLESIGRSSEALEALNRAVDRDPMHTAARSLRFDVLVRLGRHLDALTDADALISQTPGSATVSFMRGTALNDLGRHPEALACYQEAVHLDGSLASAWLNLGVTLCFLDRHGESLACFDTVLRLQPDHVSACLNRGLSRFALGQPDEAIADYDRGLALEPLNAELWFNRGVVLAEIKRSEEALACYDRALQIDPRYAEAWNNRGVVLKTLRRPAEALAQHEKAIEYKPDYVEAWTNRGWLLYGMKRYDESLASYAEALRIKPDHADAHWNESLARLLLGQFELGWKKYAYRWRIHNAKPRRMSGRPLTRVEDARPGSRILLWAEQGYGDTLQFCRYAPLLAEHGAQVVVEVQPPLKALLGSLGVDGVFAHGDALPEFDLNAALLDLPAVFGTRLDSIPASVSYLRVDPALITEWSKRLPPRDGRPRIGLCCSGNPKHVNDAQRSMPLALLAPLRERAQLFLIQKELHEEDARVLGSYPDILFMGESIASFYDSAALVENMDLVISVDTSLAHLAGALGAPVWILLPWAPEWRWMLDRTDSPWYPSATLFRQDRMGEWEGAVRRIGLALEALANRQAGATG